MRGPGSAAAYLGGFGGAARPPSPSLGESDRKEGRLVNSPQPSALENTLSEGPERASSPLASYALEVLVECVQALNCPEAGREGCAGMPVINAGNMQPPANGEGEASRGLLLV